MHLSRMEVNGDDVIIIGLNQHNLKRLRTRPIVLTPGEHGDVVPTNLRIVLYGGKTENIMISKLATIFSVLLGMKRHEKVTLDLNTSLSYERIRTSTDG